MTAGSSSIDMSSSAADRRPRAGGLGGSNIRPPGVAPSAKMPIHRLVAIARHGVLGMLAVAAALAGPGVALAASAPGVHIDPGSPAGKEYAIPLGQARSTGTPTNLTGTGSAQLFGAGITPSEPSASTRSALATSHRPAGRTTSAPGERNPRTGAITRKPAALAITPVSKLLGGGSGESSGLWWMLAAGSLVLLLGGLGGAVLARRS